MDAAKSSTKVDILTASATDLLSLLNSKAITSEKLVELYLEQIEKHNRKGAKLHAMISTVPSDLLREIAKERDKQRFLAKDPANLGPLHGIPFVVKDTMATGPEFKVPTSLGTAAFKNSIARQNASSVEKLVAAGAILLGKANLSVMSGVKGSSCLTGWSEVEGQTQSPYVVGGVVPGDTFLGHSVPGGSSSGSAVAVAAGMAPISLGAETDGSIMAPADRASLYSIKITPGLVNTDGVLPQILPLDSLGPIARSSSDIAVMLTLLKADKDYSRYLTKSWAGLKVGFLDPDLWKSSAGASKPIPGYVEQVVSETSNAAETIAKEGAKVKKWVTLRRFGGEQDDDCMTKVMWHDFTSSFAKFVAETYRDPPVTSIRGLLEFNDKHRDEALPPEYPQQDELEDCAEHADAVDQGTYEDAKKTLVLNNLDNGVEKAFIENDVDVILGAPTGRFPTIAAAARCPCGTLPLGYSKQNGRAFGLMAIARPGREDLLVQVMSAWEATFGPETAYKLPQPPPQLVSSGDSKI